MPAKRKSTAKRFTKAVRTSIKSEVSEPVAEIKEEAPEQPVQEIFPTAPVTPISTLAGNYIENPVVETPQELKSEPSSDIISEIIAKHDEAKTTDEPQTLKENTPDKPKEKEQKHHPKFIIIFLVFLFGLLLGAGSVYLYLNKFSEIKKLVSKKQSPPAEVSITPSPVPEATEAPVNLKKYSVSILNGSKTVGLAGNLKTNLETEGFSVLSAGNATSSSFIETVIRSKTNVDKSFIGKLKIVLDKTFFVIETADLKDSEKTDVVIIIGSKTPKTTE